MTARIHPISEINQRAKELSVKEIGVVDIIRFLNQFRIGNGNYTAERDSLFKDMAARQIIAEIKARRTQDHELPDRPGIAELHSALRPPGQRKAPSATRRSQKRLDAQVAGTMIDAHAGAWERAKNETVHGEWHD